MLGTPRQTMLFSATMPKEVENLSKAFLNDPVRVQVSPPGKAADKIEQSVHHVNAREKTELLKNCLIKHDGERTLVFARTKHGAEKLMKHLVDCGVHRIGRTARAGAEGKAVAFCAPDEFHLLRQIEKLMSISIHIESGEEPEGMPAKKSSSNNRSRGRNGKPAGGGQKAGGRRGSGHRGQRGNNGEARADNAGGSSAKPKKFKNKQTSVADYDAKEQRRKDKPNRQEKRNSSGEGRFSNDKNGSSGKNDRNKDKPGQKPWKTKSASSTSNNKSKGGKPSGKKPFNSTNKGKRPPRKP